MSQHRNQQQTSILADAAPRLRLNAFASALAAGLFVLPAAPALAATIMVNGGACTLVEAITAANTDMATGSCTAGSGPDTLVLTANQILTAVNNGTYGPNGLPVVSSEITIQGNGRSITRVSADPFRILTVDSTGNLTLQQTTVSGGLLTSGHFGAGIANNFGVLSLVDSTVLGNTAGSRGGGISNRFGTLNLSNSTVSGNRGSFGGGIVSYTSPGGPDSTTLSNSTISGNSASLNGGGVRNSIGRTVIRNSTLTHNTAPDGSGAGVASYGDADTFTEVSSSLIVGNNGTDVDLFPGVAVNSFTSLGANLIGDGNAVADFNQPGDQVGVADPGLQALANNGGSTLTHALNPTSPAVDAVTGACPPPASDQRGFARPVGAACDIGAFEFGAVVPTPAPALVTSRFTASLSGQSTNPTPVAEGAAGVFSFTSRFCNISAESVSAAFSRSRVLSPGKSLISRTRDAAAAPLGGVGSEQDFPDTLVTPSECVNVLYRIGLDARTPFTFRVDLLGTVVP